MHLHKSCFINPTCYGPYAAINSQIVNTTTTTILQRWVTIGFLDKYIICFTVDREKNPKF